MQFTSYVFSVIVFPREAKWGVDEGPEPGVPAIGVLFLTGEVTDVCVGYVCVTAEVGGLSAISVGAEYCSFDPPQLLKVKIMVAPATAIQGRYSLDKWSNITILSTPLS